MARLGGVEQSGWSWVGARGQIKPDPLRTWVVVVVVGFGVLVLAALGVAWLSLTGWEGTSVRVTNGCGFELYMDDGYDGLRVPPGQSIEWRNGSESRAKTLRVWRATDRLHSQGLSIEVHDGATLTGARCPAGAGA